MFYVFILRVYLFCLFNMSTLSPLDHTPSKKSSPMEESKDDPPVLFYFPNFYSAVV